MLIARLLAAVGFLSIVYAILSVADPLDIPLLGDVDLASWYGINDLIRAYTTVAPDVNISIVQSVSAATISGMQSGAADFGTIAVNLSTTVSQTSPTLSVLPFMLNAVVPIYRIDALGSSAMPLILSRDVLSRIYLANITYFNDPAIVALNPSLSLPNQPICMIMDTGASVKNLVLKQAISLFSPALFAASGQAVSTAFDWPIGRYACYKLVAVALTTQIATVYANDGSFGCSYNAPVQVLGSSTALMVNRAGQTVSLSSNSMTHAAVQLGANVPISTRYVTPLLMDSPSQSAWPMTLYTSILIDSANSRGTCKARQDLVDFLLWIYQSSTATSVIEARSYAPVPSIILTDLEIISFLEEQVLCQGSPALPVTVTDTRTIAVPSHVSFLTGLIDFVYQPNSSSAVWTTFISNDSNDLQRLIESEVDAAIINPLQINSATMQYVQNSGEFLILPLFSFAWSWLVNVQLNSTLNLGSSGQPLVLDESTIWLIRYACVVNWNDPTILSLNPWLGLVLGNGSFPITLVDMCPTETDGAPGYHFLANQAATYMANNPDSAAAMCIANHTQSATLSCTKSSSLLIAQSQTAANALLLGVNGGQSYMVASGDPTYFLPVMQYMSNNGATLRNSPTLTSIMACSQATFDAATLSFDFSASQNTNCWPWTSQYLFMVRTQYYSDSAVTNASSCLRGLDTLQFAQFLFTSKQLRSLITSSNFGQLSADPLVSSAYTNALNAVLCDQETLLITLPVQWSLSSGISVFVYLLASMGLLGCLALGSLVVYYHRHPVIRSASPMFLLLSVVGVGLLFMAAFLLVAPISVVSCSAFSWLVNFGLILTFSPLFAKTWRIYRIFGRKKLSVVAISNKKLMLICAAILAVELALMSGWQVAGNLQPITNEVTTSDVVTLSISTGETRFVVDEYVQCGVSSGPSKSMFIVVMVEKGLLFVFGALMAFTTRKVSSTFNESSGITLAIYNVCFTVGIIAPIILVISAVGDVLTLLLAFALLWIAFFTGGILFVPKIAKILFHNDGNVQEMTSVQASSQSSSGYIFMSIAALSTVPVLQGYQAALQKHLGQVQRKIDQLKGGSAALGAVGEGQRPQKSPPKFPRSSQSGQLNPNSGDGTKNNSSPFASPVLARGRISTDSGKSGKSSPDGLRAGDKTTPLVVAGTYARSSSINPSPLPSGSRESSQSESLGEDLQEAEITGNQSTGGKQLMPAGSTSSYRASIVGSTHER